MVGSSSISTANKAPTLPHTFSHIPHLAYIAVGQQGLAVSKLQYWHRNHRPHNVRDAHGSRCQGRCLDASLYSVRHIHYNVRHIQYTLHTVGLAPSAGPAWV